MKANGKLLKLHTRLQIMWLSSIHSATFFTTATISQQCYIWVAIFMTMGFRKIFAVLFIVLCMKLLKRVFGKVRELRPHVRMSEWHLQSENCKRVQFTTSYMESYHLYRYTLAKEFIPTPCISKLLNINITKPKSLGVISLMTPFS